MSTSTRFGIALTRCSWPSASANCFVSSSVASEPMSGTDRCKPLPPDVFTTHCNPSCSSVSRRSSATRQQSTIVAGSPGSRSMHERGRVRGVGHRPLVRVQFERGEVREPHQRRRPRRRCSPWCRRSPRSRATCRPTRDGATGSSSRRSGCPPGPSGARTRVGGRPARWGSIDGRDPAVVVDDVGLAEPGGGVEHLVEVRERELPALDLDRPVACPRHI